MKTISSTLPQRARDFRDAFAAMMASPAGEAIRGTPVHALAMAAHRACEDGALLQILEMTTQEVIDELRPRGLDMVPDVVLCEYALAELEATVAASVAQAGGVGAIIGLIRSMPKG